MIQEEHNFVLCVCLVLLELILVVSLVIIIVRHAEVCNTMIALHVLMDFKLWMETVMKYVETDLIWGHGNVTMVTLLMAMGKNNFQNINFIFNLDALLIVK